MAESVGYTRKDTFDIIHIKSSIKLRELLWGFRCWPVATHIVLDIGAMQLATQIQICRHSETPGGSFINFCRLISDFFVFGQL